MVFKNIVLDKLEVLLPTGNLCEDTESECRFLFVGCLDQNRCTLFDKEAKITKDGMSFKKNRKCLQVSK